MSVGASMVLIRAEALADDTRSAPERTEAASAASTTTAARLPPPPIAPAEATGAAQPATDVAGPHYRSPGIAVALSLTPVPVDFGNLYAENIAWAAAYSTAEVALLSPVMWLVGGHTHHVDGNDRAWSDEERGWTIGLVAGYVLVKAAAGAHAGYAAAAFNRDHQATGAVVLPSLAMVPGGGMLAVQGVF